MKWRDRVVHSLIDRIRESSDYVVQEDPDMGTTLRCYVVPPVSWDLNTLQSSLQITLPPELIQLWQIASSVTLWEDITHRQWGLHLWSPNEVLRQNREQVVGTALKYLRGDLIIGEYFGDWEMPILRCDANASDFGAVQIAIPPYSRDEWPTVATSLTEFVVMFHASPGRKYWEGK